MIWVLWIWSLMFEVKEPFVRKTSSLTDLAHNCLSVNFLAQWLTTDESDFRWVSLSKALEIERVSLSIITEVPSSLESVGLLTSYSSSCSVCISVIYSSSVWVKTVTLLSTLEQFPLPTVNRIRVSIASFKIKYFLKMEQIIARLQINLPFLHQQFLLNFILCKCIILR